VAAGPAIAAAARLADAREVAAAAAQGHPAAVAALDRATAAVAHAVVGIVSLLDVDAVVLGGGVGAAIPAFADRARAAVADLAQPQTREGVSVLPAQLGDDAFLVGAARLALDAQQQQPG
jgi:glucokinase